MRNVALNLASMNHNSTQPPDTANSDEILEKRELAGRLKISTRTLDQWMRDGLVPFLKIGRKTVRFRWVDVLAHLEGASRRIN